jgi:hypothetical protein
LIYCAHLGSNLAEAALRISEIDQTSEVGGMLSELSSETSNETGIATRINILGIIRT